MKEMIPVDNSKWTDAGAQMDQRSHKPFVLVTPACLSIDGLSHDIKPSDNWPRSISMRYEVLNSSDLFQHEYTNYTDGNDNTVNTGPIEETPFSRFDDEYTDSISSEDDEKEDVEDDDLKNNETDSASAIHNVLPYASPQSQPNDDTYIQPDSCNSQYSGSSPVYYSSSSSPLKIKKDHKIKEANEAATKSIMCNILSGPQKVGKALNGEKKAIRIGVSKDLDLQSTRILSRISGSAASYSRPVPRWTKKDDELICYLKEVKEYSWRQISLCIKSRHSCQAVQMRYLRSLKSRLNSWTVKEEQKLKDVIAKDWSNRWKRVSGEMGSSFSTERCLKKAMILAGMGHFLDSHQPQNASKLGFNNRESSKPENIKEIDNTNYDEFVIPESFLNRLPIAAEKFMKRNEFLDDSNLINMYVAPKKH